VSTAYDGATKLDSIGRLVRVYDGGRRPTDVDDCGARFEESEGLRGFVARLWNDKHDSYEVVSQGSAVDVIGQHSEERTRGRGLEGGGIVRVWIRGFLGWNGGHHANKLNIVVHR
jgi:hypothetical protein